MHGGDGRAANRTGWIVGIINGTRRPNVTPRLSRHKLTLRLLQVATAALEQLPTVMGFAKTIRMERLD